MTATVEQDPRCDQEDCSCRAEVRAIEARTVVIDDAIYGHHEPTRTLCFDHFLEMVDKLQAGWRISAVHREESEKWADAARILPDVRLLLTPELRERLDASRNIPEPLE